MRASRNKTKSPFRVVSLITCFIFTLCILSSCAKNSKKSNAGPKDTASANSGKVYFAEDEINTVDDNYRTCYEIFVYSFYDSNGDGIGDIKGVTDKLDYINDGDAATFTDLGCNEIWLMPVMTSPTYHKYDITDYYSIDASYGTMEDFESLVESAHARGINVIMDLVMNHTSTTHQWFLSAAEYLRGLPEGEEADASACPYVDYYRFNKEGGAGYAPLSGTDWYYEARFWSEMPDLNLDNEAVKAEFKDICKFWLDKGVDGFRLDAVTYYETGNRSKNIEILNEFNTMVKEIKPDCYVVGEAYTYSEEYVPYYESGIDSLFDFDFADAKGVIAKTLTGAASAGASSYGQAVQSVEEEIAKYSDSYIDAPFLSNHDMARASGYFPGDDGTKLKLAHAMSLLMSGNAFVYYGEEIGMKGSGKDENKRLAMYWTADGTAEGMCSGPADADKTEMKYDAADAQAGDPDSILSFVRNLIRIRNTYPEIARGKQEFLSDMSDDKICIIKKNYEGDIAYVVFNISDETVTVDKSSLGEGSIKAALSAGTGEFDTESFDKDTFSMPAGSVAVIK